MAADYWAGKTVLVTGGLGFIGSHMVEELVGRGAHVLCVYRREKPEVLAELPASPSLTALRIDVLDYDALLAVAAAVPRVDAVINCATLDGNMQFLLEESGRMLDENMRIVSNVLNLARHCRIPDVVLISSAEIYSYDGTEPMREEDDHRRHMEFSPNGYRMSKMFTEVLADLYRKQFGMNIYTPRLTNVYGPRDDFDTTTNHVIPNMLMKLAAGQDIEIWGDGSQLRTFIHVQDVVRAILCMVRSGTCETLNIGTSESVSIRDLAYLVAEAAGHTKNRVRFDPDKPVGAARRALDLDNFHRVVDFTPRSLKDGLLDTVQWHRKKAQRVR
ncbi:NAD(P)-dependent oxidoreductase [Streptomyces sp. Rer75]|uniref:NAD-dependent epimerase/dehydratase family protein n=1 Tax=Streptomyces sp. Rer75 TaxID=2750011 RepID=UPI0015CF87CE|nr:SDR family NAD(P)-dependent oxidoreductase [Streptomyces sp. Rer75]QLH24139.1 SDR family NAD(P)-dependent oxidoreductase [Streptomyces sp. Rer75]